VNEYVILKERWGKYYRRTNLDLHVNMLLLDYRR